MTLPAYSTCDPVEDPPAVRITRAIRYFDWVEANYLFVVALDVPREERNRFATALSRLVESGSVEANRDQHPPRYRLSRAPVTR